MKDKFKLEFNIEETRNLDECMQWVKSHMCSSEKGDEYFKECLLKSEADAMIMIHHGYGMFIRNTLQLWHSGPAVAWFNSQGIFHADDMSGIIFTSLHRKENNLEINLDEQISRYRKHWEKCDPRVNEGKMN
jgi:hypothetical protein